MQRNSNKILVVDDDPDILAFTRALLELEGYNVATTEKGEDLEYLDDNNSPQLIVLDMLLSGIDGRTIARRLKSQEETRKIPILMISALPSAESEAKLCGVDDFLAKPFDMDVFLAKIAKYF
jgi:DNA-binding response OmpR family regulator